MELVVAHFVDPVSAMVVIESEDGSVRFSQVPDPHCTISSTSCHRMQATLVICKVEYLVDMGGEPNIACFACLLSKIDDSYRVFNRHSD